MLIFLSHDRLLFSSLSPQGDIGEKGPEGAPGKDGARVSDCHSFGFS